ncbi:2Fe-2S iron-sulfur cluster binding domain-containing protein, partial [Candidatus Calescamantes bacterium]|nr:2Fe-2S iron-sulfur cluster binding domain-containing protein [Candidatus Calescamantes bacterium]
MGRMYFPQYKKGRKGISLHKGLTILEHLRELGIEINAECGGKGECGRCVVRIEKGMENLNGLTHHEISFSLPLGERLACQARIVRDTSDIVVFIKEFGKYEILKRSKEREVPLNPLTCKRGSKVLYNHEVLDDYRGGIYGLAIDVGTTTLVFDIVNLQSGEVIATIAKTNPQILYGNDVISRIEYTMVNKKSNSYLEEDERVKRLKELQR